MHCFHRFLPTMCLLYSPSVLFHKSQKEFSIFTLFFPAWTWINGISKLFKNAVHIIDDFIIFFFVKYRHDTSKISWSRSVRKKIGIIFDPVLNFSRYLRLVNWSDFSKAYWFYLNHIIQVKALILTSWCSDWLAKTGKK